MQSISVNSDLSLTIKAGQTKKHATMLKTEQLYRWYNITYATKQQKPMPAFMRGMTQLNFVTADELDA